MTNSHFHANLKGFLKNSRRKIYRQLKTVSASDRTTGEASSTTDGIQRTTDEASSTTDGIQRTTDEASSTTDGIQRTTDEASSTTDGIQWTTDEAPSMTDGTQSTTDEVSSTTDGIQWTTYKTSSTTGYFLYLFFWHNMRHLPNLVTGYPSFTNCYYPFWSSFVFSTLFAVDIAPCEILIRSFLC